MLLTAVSSLDEIIAQGLNWTANKMDKLLLTEKNYIPSSEYKPVFGIPAAAKLAKDLVVKLFEEAADNELLKDIDTALNDAFFRRCG